MIKIEYLIENKNTIDEVAKQLNTKDIEYLINLLNEKNNEVRYTAFLLLQSRSQMFSDVYKYWKDFCQKLSNSNSYQRSIGIMLIAENNRWDDQNKFEDIIDIYLSHCEDEKFITAGQTIQSINKWIMYKKGLLSLVVRKLISIDISRYKDSQGKLILLDIINVLSEIQKIQPTNDIMEYIDNVIKGEYLNNKDINEIEKLF
ncbi:hypothetical protein NSA52_11635 [Clostridium sporogenes]|uniref:hypothetical protein n=1 Tax=Clostridium sporogenes TaxID=1509 RepID=UPI00214A27F7|nr:hypothetical protein [Clostridium sporogenes]MCR1974772.1 hypothetical protein [Clostridium sporogenes]